MIYMMWLLFYDYVCRRYFGIIINIYNSYIPYPIAPYVHRAAPFYVGPPTCVHASNARYAQNDDSDDFKIYNT